VSRLRASPASAVALGVALAGVAFGAAGGTELGRTAVVEVLLVLAGGAAIVAAVMVGPRGAIYGGSALVAFMLLALVTAVSITWSIAPELSYIEAGRTLAYLAVFAAAMAAARLKPQAAPVVLQGVLVGVLLVLAYSVASRVWPATLAANEFSNRLQAPFDYWNAVGTVAALGVPATIWLGARRAGAALARALAYPAMAICVVAIMLTQSRGALVAAMLGGVLWFAIVPLRLRSLPVLVVPSLLAAPVGLWALSKDAFSKSLQPLAVRESVAGEFGLLLLLLVVACLAAGFAVNFGLSRNAPSAPMRKRIGIAAGLATALVPLALFTSVAFSERGLSGTIDERVDQLTSSETAAPAEGAGRIADASSTRGKYWREAGKVFSDRPAIGTGAGTFGNSRLRYRTDEGVSRHAHGFVAQTLADTGVLGLVASVLLLVAWLAAALRTTGLLPRFRRFGVAFRRRDWDAERIALVGLLLVAVVFGVQSVVDWTWFVPGPAVMALVAAGFVAGRGPVGALAGAPTGVPARPGGPGRESRKLLLRPLNEPARFVAAAAVGACALLFAWAIWQPEASNRASNRALELAYARDYQDALAKADDAGRANPLSPRPLFVRAVAQTQAGDIKGGRASLERAVLKFPGDPQTWLRLATFQLTTLNRPEEALGTVEAVLYLDPLSKAGRALFYEARNRARAKAERAP
jgi:hypothetical protein